MDLSTSPTAAPPTYSGGMIRRLKPAWALSMIGAAACSTALTDAVRA